jgi:hypothetical protein
MALTINPAVSGTRREWVLQSLSFFLGSVLGGLVTLLLILAVTSGLISLFGRQPVVIGFVVVVVFAILRDFGVPVLLPYRSRQVPELLREQLPGAAFAAAYGFELGVGFLTLFTYSIHLAVVLALPFLPATWEMLAAVVLFALGRSVVLLITMGAREVDEVAERFYWTPRLNLLLKVTTAAGSALLAGLLLLPGGLR